MCTLCDQRAGVSAYAFDTANIAQDELYPLTGSEQAGVITILSVCAALGIKRPLISN